MASWFSLPLYFLWNLMGISLYLESLNMNIILKEYEYKASYIYPCVRLNTSINDRFEASNYKTKVDKSVGVDQAVLQHVSPE